MLVAAHPLGDALAEAGRHLLPSPKRIAVHPFCLALAEGIRSLDPARRPCVHRQVHQAIFHSPDPELFTRLQKDLVINALNDLYRKRGFASKVMRALKDLAVVPSVPKHVAMACKPLSLADRRANVDAPIACDAYQVDNSAPHAAVSSARGGRKAPASLRALCSITAQPGSATVNPLGPAVGDSR